MRFAQYMNAAPSEQSFPAKFRAASRAIVPPQRPQTNSSQRSRVQDIAVVEMVPDEFTSGQPALKKSR